MSSPSTAAASCCRSGVAVWVSTPTSRMISRLPFVRGTSAGSTGTLWARRSRSRSGAIRGGSRVKNSPSGSVPRPAARSCCCGLCSTAATRAVRTARPRRGRTRDRRAGERLCPLRITLIVRATARRFLATEEARNLSRGRRERRHRREREVRKRALELAPERVRGDATFEQSQDHVTTRSRSTEDFVFQGVQLRDEQLSRIGVARPPELPRVRVRVTELPEVVHVSHSAKHYDRTRVVALTRLDEGVAWCPEPPRGPDQPKVSVGRPGSRRRRTATSRCSAVRRCRHPR
jgi:hypothetical protein